MSIQSCCLRCAQAGGTSGYQRRPVHTGTWHRYLRTHFPGEHRCPKERHNPAVPRDGERLRSHGRTSSSRERKIPQSSSGWQHRPHSVPALQPGTCPTAAKSITNQPKPKLFLLMTPQISCGSPRVTTTSSWSHSPRETPLLSACKCLNPPSANS